MRRERLWTWRHWVAVVVAVSLGMGAALAVVGPIPGEQPVLAGVISGSVTFVANMIGLFIAKERTERARLAAADRRWAEFRRTLGGPDA